jgi:hypothetical protein
VLNVQPHSPASDVVVFPSAEAARDGLRTAVHTSLVSYLDFIVSVNGEPLGPDDSELFAEEVRANEGAPVILEVWNVKASKLRTVQVVPRSGWGGDGLLGLHVKYDSLDDGSGGDGGGGGGGGSGGADAALHVTDVEPFSPAALGGLLPGDDFILGSNEGAFDSVSPGGMGGWARCVGQQALRPLT